MFRRRCRHARTGEIGGGGKLHEREDAVDRIGLPASFRSRRRSVRVVIDKCRRSGDSSWGMPHFRAMRDVPPWRRITGFGSGYAKGVSAPGRG
ncbi:hypothetical protein NSU_2705 [Novosphingobium pentaromativorans US6-1]|uniref:Uncharacterized protein n=1 Tax=Novosphingobium pentaromativorans US6-1 TaxID=1088721 RepID=G6EED4_9SPHN|nr:hypothetical protein NSU_2705 [Novosphingobium pentaromativorans US6-1]